MVLSFIIQQTLQSRFKKYSDVASPSGMSGAEVAAKMLRDNGIYDVEILQVSGTLSDHYNPLKKTVNLSEDVYNGRNIAAAAVATHECGHVVQHAKGYLPLKLRSAMVPVVSFSNMIVQWVILAGVLLINIFPQLLWAGIALMALSTVFSVITLPVEINASARAVAWLTDNRVVDEESRPMVVDALKWAAYTYVIATIGSIATLLYYIGIARRR